ncbi:GNAT family N-acetyltransferase [Lichenicoccus roseus]|nr:GNAT family N-acetyltransferase [Lichenicoccus roseus]
MEIRAAGAQEAAGLSELLAQVGISLPPHEVAQRLEAIRQSTGTALVALAWGPPSGVVVVHWHRTLLSPAPQAGISLLLVAPDERRRGIGRLLLKAAAQAARTAGCDTLDMAVSGDQPDLDAFCLANGFTGAGLRYRRPLRKGG